MRMLSTLACVTATLIASVQAEDVLDVLLKNPETRTIATMIKKEGVDTEVRGYDDGVKKWTFLAITNGAYTAQPRRNIAFLSHPRNRDTLKRIIYYHVIPGSYTAADLMKLAKSQGSAKTFGGEELKISVKGGELVLGKNAKLVSKDIKADQGYVHVIDSVLFPKGALPDDARLRI